MLSHQGTKAATGDVNSDGLTDIFICGAAGQAGQLYLQTVSGGFVKKDEKTLTALQNLKRLTPIFDCDKDGDMDLLLVPVVITQCLLRELQRRLYKTMGMATSRLTWLLFRQMPTIAV